MFFLADQPLHASRIRIGLASTCGHASTIQVGALLKGGLDINLADSKDGVTPLMVSCISNRSEVAKLLVASSADLDAADDSGRTALMYAMRVPGLENVRPVLAIDIVY